MADGADATVVNMSAAEGQTGAEFGPGKGVEAMTLASPRDDVDTAKARGMARLTQRLNSLGYEVNTSHWEVKVKYYRGRPSPGRYAWHGFQFENMERACQAVQVVAYAQQCEPLDGWAQPTEADVGWLQVAVQKGDSLLQRAVWSNAHAVLSDHTIQCKFLLCADDQYQPSSTEDCVAGNALLQAAGTKKFSAGGWKDCVQLMQQMTWQGMTFPIGSRVSFVLATVYAAEQQHALGASLRSAHHIQAQAGGTLPAADGLADAAADADVDIAAEPAGFDDDCAYGDAEVGADPVGLAAELAVVKDRLMQQQRRQQQHGGGGGGGGGNARSGKRPRKSRQAPTSPVGKEEQCSSPSGKHRITQPSGTLHGSPSPECLHHTWPDGAVVADDAAMAAENVMLDDDAHMHSSEAAHHTQQDMQEQLQSLDGVPANDGQADAADAEQQTAGMSDMPQAANAATLLRHLLFLQQHEATGLAPQEEAPQDEDDAAQTQEMQAQFIDAAYQPLLGSATGTRQRAARTGSQQQRRLASQARGKKAQKAAQEVASSADTRTTTAGTAVPHACLGDTVQLAVEPAAQQQLVLQGHFDLPSLPAPVFGGSGALAPLQEVEGLQAIGRLLRHMGHAGAVKQLWHRYNTHYKACDETRRTFALNYLQLCEAVGDQDHEWLRQVLQQQFELQL